MKFSVSLVAAIAASFLPGANAFFRMPCAGPLLLERADPIVNPSTVSDHLHNIVGGNGFNFSMTYDTAVASTCSSCMAKVDKSNYWVPNLYVKAKNGSFHNVANGGATIYYLQRRGSPDEELVPFPKGFRMFAGDPMLRAPGTSHEQKAVSFSCLGGLAKDTPDIPNAKCPYGLRAQIVMPSCWDGKKLDSDDHKSHVAYPDGTDNGKCPSTHPKRFITLFYEFLYDVKTWDSEWVNGKHPFVFSNGDPTGYSYHGDFINGWDIDILNRAINECNSPSGVIEECKVLDLYTVREMDDCIVPPSIPEPTSGWLDKLPGCNPVQPGSKKAFQWINCGAPTAIGPKQKYSIDMSAKGWEYVGCAFDSLSDRILPYRYATNDMTVPKCIDHCQSKNYTFAGLQYSEECWCGNTVASEKLGAHKCTMKCAGDSGEFCGGWQKLSLYKQTPKMMVGKHKRKHRV
ncbi:WSC-domain-containing protein [Wilcoxina mikolae CBS 423.85]|nr:WSC-domain-containing protein [Wilcoxina mikolae CBS 423.85]